MPAPRLASKSLVSGKWGLFFCSPHPQTTQATSQTKSHTLVSTSCKCVSLFGGVGNVWGNHPSRMNEFLIIGSQERSENQSDRLLHLPDFSPSGALAMNCYQSFCMECASATSVVGCRQLVWICLTSLAQAFRVVATMCGRSHIDIA